MHGDLRSFYKAKKNKNFFEKVIDFCIAWWYNGQAVAKSGSETVLENWTTRESTKHKKYGDIRGKCRRQNNLDNSFKQRVNKSKKSKTANLLKVEIIHRSVYIYNILRVWSWLRINAGGVPNTFKTNGRSGACSWKLVADGWVTREQPAFVWGITQGNLC